MKKTYNTVILDSCIEGIISLIPRVCLELEETGNLFCLVKTEYYENGDVSFDFMDVIECGTLNGLKYVNTIICINPKPQISSFKDNVLYLIWFAKNLELQFFSKDPIRENHIWEKVEWGKRAKNYNPKGKDPGNVWIPTEDDGKAHIIKHFLLEKKAIFDRIFSASLPAEDSSAIVFSNDRAISSALFDSRIMVYHVEPKNHNQKKIQVSIAATSRATSPIKSKVVFSSSEDMELVPDSSVSVVVTSPPYWDLKDYFKKGQIGQESYSEYLSRMESVWRQCYYKLLPEGSMWININIRRHDNRVILIPRDIVLSCKRLGFHYKGIVIWHKSSGIPTHARNLVDRHEYVLVFSKSEKLHIKADIMNGYADYKNELINGGTIWNINRKAGSVGKHYIHPAIYPNGLVERIVAISTNESQLVLDPFLGSGTSLIAAEKCGRRCVGYEYNEGFKELIQMRINNERVHSEEISFIEP